VQFAAWLEKEGQSTTTYLERLEILARRGANLLDPESVKTSIAKQRWNNGTKMLAVFAYDAFAEMAKLSWTPPKYTQPETLPFIPDEKELDQLIAGFKSRVMVAYLQTLKETFADPGEALKLRWIDVDSQNNTITINQPVKGHYPRQLKVSTKLIAMLNALPKKSERIFPQTYHNLHATYRQTRTKIAHRLQSPRLLKIRLNTFRHWGATMTYHYTRDILLVKKLLGHKRFESTLKYTKLIQFEDNEFDVSTATTVEEAKDLLTVGFNYILEKNGIMLFRRPKRFAGKP
jgi:integrase